MRSYFVAQAGLQLIAPFLCLLDAGRPGLGHHTCYDTFEKRFELGPRHNTCLWDAEDPFQTGTWHLSIVSFGIQWVPFTRGETGLRKVRDLLGHPASWQHVDVSTNSMTDATHLQTQCFCLRGICYSLCL